MRLHVTRQGSGIPMVWLHAFPFSSKMWEGQLEHFAPSYEVIVPDLSGFGASPRFPEGFTMEKAARAVFETLDALKVKEPVVLGGLSMGGYIAFECVRAFPDRIRALILTATKASADTAEGRAGRMKTIEAVQDSGMEVFSRMFIQKCLGPATLSERPEVVSRVREMIMEASPESVMDGLRGLADRRDSLALLGQITCPTLVVAGAEDRLIPVADHEVMQQGIPGAQLRIIPHVGHLVNVEAPDLFHGAVEDFLNPLFEG